MGIMTAATDVVFFSTRTTSEIWSKLDVYLNVMYANTVKHRFKLNMLTTERWLPLEWHNFHAEAMVADNRGTGRGNLGQVPKEPWEDVREGRKTPFPAA